MRACGQARKRFGQGPQHLLGVRGPELLGVVVAARGGAGWAEVMSRGVSPTTDTSSVTRSRPCSRAALAMASRVTSVRSGESEP